MGNWIRALRRVLDYAKDPNPNHWRTINGAKVHLDASGKYDGGAQGKFNGRYHYGPDWKTKSALMNRLAGALHAGVKKGNQNSSGENGSGDASFSSPEWKSLEKGLSLNGVKERPPTRHSRNLTEAEIINRISGGDETKGSCASAAMAYVANKAGFDVLDFRGGISQWFFSRWYNLSWVAHLPGVDGTEKIVKVEARAAAEELQNLEKGKEYYFCAGRHAAIVKNTDEGPQYLELQSQFKERNGWRKLGNLKRQIIPRLNKRFGCAKSQRTSYGRKFNSRIIIIDVESLMKSKEFIKLAGYFNTSPEQQQKGARGHVK